MTNTSEYVPRPTSARVHLPLNVYVSFIVAPMLLAFGTFLIWQVSGFEWDWVIWPLLIGAGCFTLGLALLTAGFVLVGTRAIAQGQVDILLGVERQ